MSEVRENRGRLIDVLAVALPLVLASACHAINMFVDRLMLTRYSQAAAAASLGGGLTNFTISCFFFGTVSYTGTFVAQYAGARQYGRIGIAVWQGIFMALASGALLASGFFWAGPFFSLFPHTPEVIAAEVSYFQILSLGVFIFLSSCAISCFWTGRGKTVVVLAVSVIITLANIPLNYLFIYGWRGVPELGIVGAGIGTVAAEAIGLLVYLGLFFAPSARRHFNTGKIRPDGELLRRMLRYGAPNGVQLLLDMIGFNTFCLVLGSYGAAVFEATSIAFGINTIAFCPVMGVGQTASILVGQAIGAGDIPLAKRSVRNAFILITIYTVIMIGIFTGLQDLVLSPFIRSGDPAQLEAIRLTRIMLLLICSYLLVDGGNIVLSNALRGAGDTRFTMALFGLVGVLGFALPCVALYYLGAPWWALWVALDSEIFLLALIFYLRFRQGKWTKMRVIEDAPRADA